MKVTMRAVRVQHTDPSKRKNISKFIEIIRGNHGSIFRGNPNPLNYQ